MRPLCLAMGVLIGTAQSALAANVDWKLYGGLTKPLTQIPQRCFYEERGITHDPSTGYIRVWVKCLKEKDLDGTALGKPYSDAVFGMTVSRAKYRYFPPIAKVEHLAPDSYPLILVYEALADMADFQPQSRLYYELDCKGKRLRPLSGDVGNQSFSQPLEWNDIPPEGNGANLR